MYVTTTRRGCQAYGQLACPAKNPGVTLGLKQRCRFHPAHTEHCCSVGHALCLSCLAAAIKQQPSHVVCGARSDRGQVRTHLTRSLLEDPGCDSTRCHPGLGGSTREQCSVVTRLAVVVLPGRIPCTALQAVQRGHLAFQRPALNLYRLSHRSGGIAGPSQQPASWLSHQHEGLPWRVMLHTGIDQCVLSRQKMKQ